MDDKDETQARTRQVFCVPWDAWTEICPGMGRVGDTGIACACDCRFKIEPLGEEMICG